jgi:Tol biopolymer transport system component
LKSVSQDIFRATKARLGEERVYSFDNPPLFPLSILPFPGGDDLLVATAKQLNDDEIHLYKVNIRTQKGTELALLSGSPRDLVWGEPGKKVLLSRTVNGLTNLWIYSLADRSFAQITFGAGPDFRPMLYPDGKGILYVNGKGSGFLTAYHVRSKSSADIVSENASQPAISPDGKRVMYIKYVDQNKTELWVSDIDGSKQTKLFSSAGLGTGFWSSDGSLISFVGSTGGESKGFRVGADGSGLRQIESVQGSVISVVWSTDGKALYISGPVNGRAKPTIWKADADGSHVEKFLDDCCLVIDASTDGKRLLGLMYLGDDLGLFQVSIRDKKRFPLAPGVATLGAHYSPDGKSVVYAIASRGEATFYRQALQDENPVGRPQIALKLPFTFRSLYNGNAFDFSTDLSTIVYARPGGQNDLYLLTRQQ